MPRVDKTDSAIGVVRGTLNADIVSADYGKVIGVGFNSAGKVVRGAGQTGIKGVIIVDRLNGFAGMRCDVFKIAEIVEFPGAAGTEYYAAAADGVISTTNTGTKIGYTVEADRLVITCG